MKLKTIFRYLTDEFGDNGPNGTKKIFGLIQSTWGGTRVEAWTPQYALDPCGVSPYTDRQTPANSNSWLFNAMIHPLLRQTIFGVLWYQGEKWLDGQMMNKVKFYATCQFPLYQFLLTYHFKYLAPLTTRRINYLKIDLGFTPG